jgi:hypothetical protein
MRESVQESARYQSREFPAGKPSLALARGSSFALLGAFAVAAWANHWPLSLLTAAALMWRLPFRPLEPQPLPATEEVARPPALALPERPATIRLDSPFLVACWLLSTWALWQHRLLPLAVCIAALALALLDARERADRSVS